MNTMSYTELLTLQRLLHKFIEAARDAKVSDHKIDVLQMALELIHTALD